MPAVQGALEDGDLTRCGARFAVSRASFDRRPVARDLRYPIPGGARRISSYGATRMSALSTLFNYPPAGSDYTSQPAATYAGLMRDMEEATARGVTSGPRKAGRHENLFYRRR